jgi:hypothetical protein
MTIIVLALKRRLRSTQRVFLGLLILKKKRVGYPSVMNFEGQLASRSQEIFDLIIEGTYANEPCVPSDLGPYDVSEEPPFGSLQFTVLEVLNALLNLDSNKGPGPDGVPLLILKVVLQRLHCHFVCSSTGHWRLAFFLMGESSRLLRLF